MKWACCVAVIGALGCGSDSPFDYIPVTGKVTYEDGSLIQADQVRLSFDALDYEGDLKMRPRPGKTTINADGTFDNVTSYKYGDGLVPGRHRVGVVPLDKNGQITNAVPPQYTSSGKSPLIITTDELPLHIKVPKP